MSDSIDSSVEQADDTIIESCLEINELDAIEARAGFNGLLKDAPKNVSTSIVNGLSQQLIYQIDLIVPDALVSFDDLDVDLADAAFPFLQPPAKQALQKAIQSRGIKLVVNSAYRTIAQQMLLYNWRGSNSNPVAKPGSSNHQSGLALDINDRQGWLPFLKPYGWQPLAGDPPHIDYKGQGFKDLRKQTILAFQKLWNKNNPNEKIGEDGIYAAGGQTEKALNRSPSTGFAHAPWDDRPRVLRLCRPTMEGSDVKKLQEYFKNAGMAVSVDGVFGPGTDKAVKEFQQKNNLVGDGIVGDKTRKLIA
ncbi:peptidoglycan-binding protein [Argonema antarcticum]|uniref:peptidoglycan-binding protein n=1 Tax=Argonema antarcticum TaxID=2942763 RepID=UPI0020116BAC|nr:peptidoglycan-binding protein [Argonema antarcticum]MCL1474584.1 peptidoglycan-binding protein [Argonema antarcticum A004/B2]